MDISLIRDVGLRQHQWPTVDRWHRLSNGITTGYSTTQ